MEPVPWSVRLQSVVKPGNDVIVSDGQAVVRSSEDRLRVDATASAVLAAVSDGAGSSGLFCGPWAETLLARLPGRALSGLTELDGWLGGFCGDFHRRHAALLATWPMRRSKFVREGSCATLLACWLERRDSDVALRWLGYGDSMMLVFDHAAGRPELVRACPGGPAVLGRDPHLLNWKDVPVAAGLETGEMALSGRMSVVLASDAVGQYALLRAVAAGAVSDPAWTGFFRRMATGGQGRLADLARAHEAAPAADFAGEWLAWGRALEGADSFADWVRGRHDLGLMANDDATLIMVDVETAPAAADGAVEETEGTE